jgi:hypothetical protein
MMTPATLKNTRTLTEADRDVIVGALLYAYHHTRQTVLDNPIDYTSADSYWRCIVALQVCNFPLDCFEPLVFAL